MTLVRVLRELWDRRLLVAIGLSIATIIAILVSFRIGIAAPPQLEARQYHVGIASAAVLVDSPSSQIADLGPAEAKADVVSLSARARLLGNLLAASPLKEAIARRAGIAPRALIAVPPPTLTGTAPSPLDGETRGSDQHASIFRVYVNDLLPIITIDAQSPSPRVAARISSAAVVELQLYLRSVAAADKVPNVRQLVLQPLGPARSSLVRRGPRKLYSLLAFMFVFGTWCGGILAVTAFARSWRTLSASDAARVEATSLPEGPAPESEKPAAPPEHAAWDVGERPRSRVASP